VSSTLLSGMQLALGGVALFIVAFSCGEAQTFSPTSVSAASLERRVISLQPAAWSLCGLSLASENRADPLVTTYTFIQSGGGRHPRNHNPGRAASASVEWARCLWSSRSLQCGRRTCCTASTRGPAADFSAECLNKGTAISSRFACAGLCGDALAFPRNRGSRRLDLSSCAAIAIQRRRDRFVRGR